MIYSHEVQHMCVVKKGPNHGPAPIPEEGKWVRSKEIKDISGLTHGIGWCAPQQGACKLTLNIKDGIIEEALIETIGCSTSCCFCFRITSKQRCGRACSKSISATGTMMEM